MTANQIVNIAADLLGYSRNDIYKPEINRVINAVNAIYSDLFYIKHESGFKRINGLQDEIELEERILNDIMPYGVAMLLAESQGDGDNQQLFAYKYNKKRSSISQKATIIDTLPTPN